MKILSIGPDRDILAGRNRALAGRGHNVHGAATRIDALAAAKSRRFDVVIFFDGFPDGYATQLAGEMRKLMPHATFLLFQATRESRFMAELEETLRNITAHPKAA